MSSEKLVAGIVTVAIAIILVAGCLIPVISESTEKEDKFTNTGMYTLDKLSVDSTYSLFWDHTKPAEVVIGTKTIDMSSLGYGTFMMIGCENFALRYFSINGGASGIQIYGDNQNFSAATSNNKDMTISISSGTMTANNGTEKTYDLGSHTYAYNAAGTGTYVLKNSATDVYAVDDSEMIIIQLTQVQGADSCGVFGIGTVEDGFTWSDFYGTATYPLTFGTETITSESVDGYIELSKVSSVSVSLTQNGTTKNPTYASFIVPTEIISERSEHLSDSLSSLLWTIPLMLVVGILVTAITIFISRRD